MNIYDLDQNLHQILIIIRTIVSRNKANKIPKRSA